MFNAIKPETIMQVNDSAWTYNDFLAFLLVYGAQMTTTITPEEIAFIQARTGATDIDRIIAQVNDMSDVEAIEIIGDYRQRFLQAEDKKEKVRHDLEDLLKSNDKPSQLDNVIIHIIEKLI